jgi:ketosteroid isomerase-like protein
MEEPSSLEIVIRFLDLVNLGNLEGLQSLISDDVVFTDIQGRVYREPKFMAEYLKSFPDYQIHLHHALVGGEGVAIIGQTTGSHVPPEIEKGEILVWTVEVQDGLISEWRIYSTEGYAMRS